MNSMLVNLGAILLVGDGLLTAFEPRKEAWLWKAGPKPYRALMEQAAARPALARMLGLLEFGLGVWIASRQWDQEEDGTFPAATSKVAGQPKRAPRSDIYFVSEDLPPKA